MALDGDDKRKNWERAKRRGPGTILNRAETVAWLVRIGFPADVVEAKVGQPGEVFDPADFGELPEAS